MYYDNFTAGHLKYDSCIQRQCGDPFVDDVPRKTMFFHIYVNLQFVECCFSIVVGGAVSYGILSIYWSPWYSTKILDQHVSSSEKSARPWSWWRNPQKCPKPQFLARHWGCLKNHVVFIYTLHCQYNMHFFFSGVNLRIHIIANNFHRDK